MMEQFNFSLLLNFVQQFKCKIQNTFQARKQNVHSWSLCHHILIVIIDAMKNKV